MGIKCIILYYAFPVINHTQLPLIFVVYLDVEALNISFCHIVSASTAILSITLITPHVGEYLNNNTYETF